MKKLLTLTSKLVSITGLVGFVTACNSNLGGAPPPSAVTNSATMTATKLLTTNDKQYTLRCHYDTQGADNVAISDAYVDIDSAISGFDYIPGTSFEIPSDIFITSEDYPAVKNKCLAALKGKPVTDIRVKSSFTKSGGHYLELQIVYKKGAPDVKYNYIVAFGDSLSDNGNLKYTRETPIRILPEDTYYNGRFSNGKTWVEQLADSNNTRLLNLAVGGAASASGCIQGSIQCIATGSSLPGIQEQVDTYLKMLNQGYLPAPANSLFTILIGANDIIFDDKANPAEISQRIKASIVALIKNGAKHVVVLNLPDLNKIPMYSRNPKFSKKAQQTQQVVNAFNQELANAVSGFNQTNPGIVDLFPLQYLFRDAINNPQKYGLDNTSKSCLLLGETGSSYVNQYALDSECIGKKFMFWDSLHPTKIVHQLIARDINNLLNITIPGSYKTTCKNIYFFSYDHKLYATCSPSSVEDSLDYDKECTKGATVSNLNGKLVCDYVPAPNQPQGSYLASCKNIRWGGSLLEASCRELDPFQREFYVNKKLNYSELCKQGSTVSNLDALICDDPISPRQDLPKGDYLRTCKNIKWSGSVLNADCTAPDGNIHNNMLVYNKCINNSSVSNDNGVLICIKPEELPEGDYLDRCSNIRFYDGILTASCKTVFSSVDASLNYNEKCAVGSKVQIVKGYWGGNELKCVISK